MGCKVVRNSREVNFWKVMDSVSGVREQSNDRVASITKYEVTDDEDVRKGGRVDILKTCQISKVAEQQL